MGVHEILLSRYRDPVDAPGVIAW
jgi:hypothetical protein